MAPVRQSRTSRQTIRMPRNPEVVRHARHSQSPPMPRAVDADATFGVDGECNRSNGAGRIAGGPVRTRAFTGCLAFGLGALRDPATSRGRPLGEQPLHGEARTEEPPSELPQQKSKQ